MDDATIAEIERWLRECARASEASEPKDDEDGAADSTDGAQNQDRPYWPYLEGDDFWRQ